MHVEGTRNTVKLAKAIDAAHFHHVSSIAAAGLYECVFREDMFKEAENYEHPHFMAKHKSEKIVRKACEVPWSAYRHAMVVGDSSTREMDKIDGSYYFFKLIQCVRQLLLPWLPSFGLEEGRINTVLVDFVVDPVGDVLNIFSQAAGAPKMNLFFNAALLGFIPRRVTKGLMALAPVCRPRNASMKRPGLPPDMLTFVNYPIRFDCRNTQAALKGSGVVCPNLKDYAWRLWDY